MLSKPKEKIQLDFIGPITGRNQRLKILLSIDLFSKWPEASSCKTTEGQTAIRFLENNINRNDVPKINRTDKATAFTGRIFREFCKNHQIKPVYRTSYIHTPRGLLERGVGTLTETLLTNIKAAEKINRVLDIAFDVKRKTPNTQLKKTAIEFHYGREPNTEVSNLLNLDALKEITKKCISAKPDSLQVYSFNGAGGVSDQIPMKQRKGSKGVRNYLFLFHEKKVTKQ